jgi:regulator of replication initiation timing
LQNKYRNTLKKEPSRIVALAEEMGLKEEAEGLRQRMNGVKRTQKTMPDKDFLQRRLENEINALYDRLAQALKSENERLRTENERLKAENKRLQK